MTKSFTPRPWTAWILVTRRKFSIVCVGLLRSSTHLSRKRNTVAVCFTNLTYWHHVNDDDTEKYLGNTMWSSRGKWPPMWLKWGLHGGWDSNILWKRKTLSWKKQNFWHWQEPWERGSCVYGSVLFWFLHSEERTSFSSTNVKLRLRFDIHLTFTLRSPDHLTTCP